MANRLTLEKLGQTVSALAARRPTAQVVRQSNSAGGGGGGGMQFIAPTLVASGTAQTGTTAWAAANVGESVAGLRGASAVLCYLRLRTASSSNTSGLTFLHVQARRHDQDDARDVGGIACDNEDTGPGLQFWAPLWHGKFEYRIVEDATRDDTFDYEIEAHGYI